jgi:hypothetical protein
MVSGCFDGHGGVDWVGDGDDVVKSKWETLRRASEQKSSLEAISRTMVNSKNPPRMAAEIRDIAGMQLLGVGFHESASNARPH